jgi:predicted HicB family RNase H-like nuclease
MENTKQKEKAFNFHVSFELWTEVKIAALRQGIPVRKWITSAIEASLKRMEAK